MEQQRNIFRDVVRGMGYSPIPLPYNFMYDIILRPWDKADYSAALKFINAKVGAEIGVYNGEFSSFLLADISDLKMYLIDPYKEYDDRAIKDCQRIHDARYEYVKELFKDKNAVVIRAASREALSQVNEILDFVYIDANHSLDEVSWDIENWSKKVRDGGIISGHDFSMQYPHIINTVLRCGIKPIHIFGTDSIWMYRKENRCAES